MKVIKELSMVIYNIPSFEFPLDTRIKKLVFNFIYDDNIYNKNYILSIKNWLINNPVVKYPLISEYHKVYSEIIDFIIRKSTVESSVKEKVELSYSDYNDFKLLFPKYCYENIDFLGDKAIDGILNSPRYSFKYIKDVVYKNLIKDNSNRDVIKILESKYDKFLKIIFIDPDSSYSYVRDIVGDIYSPAEETIFSGSDNDLKFQYIVNFEYDFIFKKNKYDYDKTKSEIKSKYDKKFYFLIKNKELSNFRVITDYLKKTLDEPDSKIEDLMEGQGSQLGYYGFLKGYYLKLETIKDDNADYFKKMLNIKDIFKEKHPRFIDNIDYDIKYGDDF